MFEEERIDWYEYAMLLAFAAAKRSEDPHHKVGACAFGKDHMVLGLGYNGLASGRDAPPSFWKDRDARRPYMIHAETNCLSLCKKGEVELLAVSLLPCSFCATMIAAYGVKEVLYHEDYKNDDKAKEILGFYNIELLKFT
jgi:dCMP deaminase